VHAGGDGVLALARRAKYFPNFYTATVVTPTLDSDSCTLAFTFNRVRVASVVFINFPMSRNSPRSSHRKVAMLNIVHVKQDFQVAFSSVVGRFVTIAQHSACQKRSETSYSLHPFYEV
jgi:hypothetical protein